MKKLLFILITTILIGCGNEYEPLDFGKVTKVLKTDKGCKCLVSFSFTEVKSYKGMSSTDNQLWDNLWIECPDTTEVQDWVNFGFKDNEYVD